MSVKPVNIVFICGAAKEGADGIGDYTRRLACELIKNGHQASVLAFSDSFVDEVLRETQESEGVKMDVCRLPKLLPDDKKFEVLKAFIEEKNPEWISLQYVLYAFNKKGLPFGFSSQLKKAVGNRRFQIMFHELWLGMERFPVFKDRVYGFFQSRIIKRMMKELRPQVVHTHSRAYKILLQYHSIPAIHLPIFSNIPVAHELNTDIEIGTKSNLDFLLFGHISPGAPVSDFARELREYLDHNGKTARLIFAGRNGQASADWENALKAHQIPFVKKGVLETAELSDLMAACDIGIATTPVLLYEKSGSVAAMLKHGLPVLNIAVEWVPETIVSFAYSENIKEYQPGNLSPWLTNLKKHQPLKNLAAVASQFAGDLQNQHP